MNKRKIYNVGSLVVDLDDYLVCKEVKEDLGIKSNATLSDICLKVDIEDFEKKLSVIENEMGFKIIALRRLNGQFRYIRALYEEYLRAQKKQRDISLDIHLFEKSKKTIDILGINAIGPLHSGREVLIDFLKKGGQVRVLLLNPQSNAFQERELFEELHNGLVAGRLREEYKASIGICKDIINFTNFNNNIKIMSHDYRPSMALVISDMGEEDAVLNCNIYPLENKKRGLMGRHKLNISKSDRKSHFFEYQEHFQFLWNNAHLVKDIEYFIQQNRGKGKTD